MKRGWQMNNIKLKVQVTRSIAPVVHTRQLDFAADGGRCVRGAGRDAAGDAAERQADRGDQGDGGQAPLS